MPPKMARREEKSAGVSWLSWERVFMDVYSERIVFGVGTEFEGEWR